MDNSGETTFWDWVKKLFLNKEDTSLKLETLLSQAKENGLLQNDEYQMILKILKLTQLRVEEIIVPRTDMVCVEVNNDIDALVKIVIDCGHSRIPVYEATKDNIVGIIHAKDLLRIYYLDKEHTKLSDIMRDPYFVVETKRVYDLLLELKAQKIHMAIVVDEYGGTAGLVTMEDILEEIVGEIEDEYDLPRPKEIISQKDGRFLVAGRIDLDEFNTKLKTNFYSEQVDTLSGFLSEKMGRVPQKGEVFEDKDVKIIIEDADLKHVHWVKVELKDKSTGSE
ncbi:MAG: hemolysin family protein [Desulfonauticus sp.]|nr:hemolysin family protein [Desulfonauticus sp.]